MHYACTLKLNCIPSYCTDSKYGLTKEVLPFPAAWWQQHGINCLELQRIAVRILSQTCSSFGCEHSWSIYDFFHHQRRNHLAQKRLNDLSYVHYNLRLRERQIRRRSNDSVSLDSVLQESLLHDWIVDAERPALPEDEVAQIFSGGFYYFWMLSVAGVEFWSLFL